MLNNSNIINNNNDDDGSGQHFSWSYYMPTLFQVLYCELFSPLNNYLSPEF